jgi:hypothetical protein
VFRFNDRGGKQILGQFDSMIGVISSMASRCDMVVMTLWSVRPEGPRDAMVDVTLWSICCYERDGSMAVG